MSRYRYVPLALLAVGFLWAASLGVAQERRTDERGKGTDSTRAAKGKTFTGRIVRVDADKGTLVLGVGTDVDRDRDRGGRPGSGTPGTGTPERGTLDRAQKERPGAASEKGDDARRGSMLTFKFGRDIRVSLDGKDATPKDIRAGLFARVTARAGDADRTRTGGDRPRDKGDRPPPQKGAPPDRDRPAADPGRVLTAERIEVFTKPPPERGGDRGKEKRPGDRPSDRPSDR